MSCVQQHLESDLMSNSREVVVLGGGDDIGRALRYSLHPMIPTPIMVHTPESLHRKASMSLVRWEWLRSEVALIKEKRSKLSANQRRKIVAEWEEMQS